MITTMASQISRRSVLAALGLGTGVVLAGCQDGADQDDPTARPGPGRTEDTDSPTATADVPPDGALLAAALTRARELSQRCRAVTGAENWRAEAQEQTQSALDEQVAVLERLLEAGDVPVPAPPGDGAGSTAGPDGAPSTAVPGDDSATTTGGDDAEQTQTPADRAARELEQLADACRADVTPQALTPLADLTAENLPVLVAIAAQRGATAAVFGRAPQWGELQGPTGEAAVALLEAYRPAVYAFGVLAARSREDERTSYETALAPLREVTRLLTQLAGDAAPPAPLGYTLPEGSWDPEGRRQLATDLLAAIPPTITGQVPGLAGDAAGIAGSVRLLADVQHVGRGWIPVPGFPGLQVPGE